jgi:hypothetical protein
MTGLCEASGMHEKILELAAVLMALPDEVRLRLARHILPADHAVVSRHCDRAIEDAFRTAAKKFHGELKTELKFNPLAIGPCWQETIAQAAALASLQTGAKAARR